MENKLRKNKLRLLFIIVFLAIIGIVGFYFYASYQFAESMEDLAYSVVDGVEKRQKRKSDETTYGHDIKEIEEEIYIDSRLSKPIKIEYHDSKIKKQGNKIELKFDGRNLRFEDNYDKTCMACIIEHSVKGEIPGINKLVIETNYYRSSIFQMIDIGSGQIDTFTSLPIISPDYKMIAVKNYLSKDTLVMGIKLYLFDNIRFQLLRQIGRNWVAKELFWHENHEIFAKVHLVVDGEIILDEEKYIRIKRKNTAANNG